MLCLACTLSHIYNSLVCGVLGIALQSLHPSAFLKYLFVHLYHSTLKGCCSCKLLSNASKNVSNHEEQAQGQGCRGRGAETLHKVWTWLIHPSSSLHIGMLNLVNSTKVQNPQCCKVSLLVPLAPLVQHLLALVHRVHKLQTHKPSIHVVHFPSAEKSRVLFCHTSN